MPTLPNRPILIHGAAARALILFLTPILFSDIGRAADAANEFPTLYAKPSGIVAGPDNNSMWFAEQDGDRVTRIDLAGAILGSTALHAGGMPESIVVGPDGNIWVTEPAANQIAKITGSGGDIGKLVGEFSAPGAPEGIAAGPDGNIWFTESDGNKIGKMSTSGALLSEFPITPASSRPIGITAGPCGDPNLWFTEEDGSQIGKIDASGNITYYSVPNSGSILRGITAGPSGNCNVFYANRGHDTIGRVTPAGDVTDGFVPLAAHTNPIGIVASPQGDLWFTANAFNFIGRASANSGLLLNQYQIPTPSTSPDGIGLAPPGNPAAVYFGEAAGHRVGYVSLGAGALAPDLSISKSVSVSGEPGRQTLLYTLSYSNIGTQSSANVTIDEHVPFLTTFMSEGSSPGWTCDPATDYALLVGGGTCHLSLGTLGPGQGGTTTFEVREGQTEFPLPPDFSIYNLTSILGEGVDSNNANNVSDLATPDVDCADAQDPVQFALCLYHGAQGSQSWLKRAIARVERVIQQLTLYFQLRDSVFLTSPGGRRYFDTYRTYAPELRALLGTDATLRALAVSVVASWQPPLQTYLGHGGVPTLTQGMYTGFVAFLDRLRAIASPEFRSHLNFPRFQSLVGLPLDQYLLALDRAPCGASDSNLCLHNGRFRIESRWRDASGRTGIGHAVSLTGDSGYFWFFSKNNVELVVKALDACSVNGRFWVFAGGLTNVELTMTVTDTVTGQVKDYTNPTGTAFEAILDTGAFSTCTAAAASPTSGNAEAPPPPGEDLLFDPPREPTLAPFAIDACSGSATALCLDGSRFRVEASYATPTGASGAGQAVALTADTGYFWFFSPDNIEVVIKVLDACAVSSRQWVFGAGLTNVHVVLTVTDTLTGEVKIYENPLNTPFRPIQDTSAFACP